VRPRLSALGYGSATHGVAWLTHLLLQHGQLALLVHDDVIRPWQSPQRALSITQRALNVTQRALSITQRARSITQRALTW
jgi:hypothetical protein